MQSSDTFLGEGTEGEKDREGTAGIEGAQNLPNDYSLMDDNTLAAKAAADSLAAAELLNRITPMIRSAAVNTDHRIADDLFQEGILGALSAISSYDSTRGNVRTFLVSCARNRMLSSLKRNSLIGGLSDDSDTLPDEETEAYGERARLEELYAAVNCLLSATERRVILLYISGRSYREIAQRLGISEKSVDNAMQRARKKLKKHFGD